MSSKRARAESTSTSTTHNEDDAAEPNPDQQRAKQQQVTMDQKAIMLDLQFREADMINPRSGAFDEALVKTNAAALASTTVKGAVTDSRILRMLSTLLTKQALQIGNSQIRMTPGEYTNGLRTKYKEQNSVLLDLAKLGKDVKVFIRAVPRWDTMVGAINVTLPDKKVRVVKPKVPGGGLASADRAKLQKPEVINMRKQGQAPPKEEGQSGFDMHAELQKELFSVLKCQTLGASAEVVAPEFDLYELVLDPKSYTQTVENMFALSFLIKDDICGITLRQDGTPFVQARRKRESSFKSSSAAADQDDEKQYIMNMSFDDWRRLRDAYRVKSCKLSHRQDESYEAGTTLDE